MADQIQPLIDRIQKEAVQDAESEAAEILEQAQAKAAEIVREAQQKADQMKAEAEREAAAFTERSQRTLDQAARDLLLSVEQGIEHILSGVVAEELDAVLEGDALCKMVEALVESYLEKSGEEADIKVLLGPKDHEQLVNHFKQKYGETLRKGVQVEWSSGIAKGFWITLGDGSVSHDFTRDAMVEALTSTLRPALAKVVQSAAKGEQGSS